MRAQLRQRVLRPAALARGRRRRRRAFSFLLAKLARRQAEAMAKGSAEMRGIAKAVAIGNFRNRLVRFGGVGQIGPGPLQPALPYIMGEIVADPFEQFLQIAFGNSLRLRNARGRQFRVVQPALDGLANPVQQRGLGGRAARLRRRPDQLMRECQQEIDQALRDRGPFDVNKRFHGARRGIEHAREHVGEASGRHHARRAQFRFAGDAAMQCFGCHRQHDRAHVALEHHAPVAAPWQQQEMADRNDAVAAAFAEHHAILDRQQHDRQAIARLRQRRNHLRSGRDPSQRQAGRIAVRGRGMSVIKRTARSRLQADRPQHVPPCFRAVVLGIGFTRKRTKAHRIDPVGIKRSNRRARNARLAARSGSVKPAQRFRIRTESHFGSMH